MGTSFTTGYYDARIIGLDGSLCKLRFDYNPPDGVYKEPMQEDITVLLQIAAGE